MTTRVLVFLSLFATLITPVSAQAQADSKRAPSPGQQSPEIKQAIQRALQYLRSRQKEKGNWVFEREVPPKDTQKQATPKFQEEPVFNLGVTALVALAMVENGVLPSDPVIQKAYAYIKEESITNKRTYNLGLTILFLTRLASREDRPLVQRLARRLMLGQFDSGGWPYDCPLDAERESSRAALQGWTRKTGVGDNSNTQFAIMGLWAASRAGVQVDEPLELVAKRFRESQASSGGWDYQSTGKADSDAMTSAGVYALTVAAAAASRKASAHAASGSSGAGTKSKSGAAAAGSAETAPPSAASAKAILADDPIFKKGIARVEQFAAGIAKGTSPYFLWSIERLGVTLQMPTIGQVDWYAKGVPALLESQRTDGSWEISFKGIPDTSFGLLFLRKAHLGRDISYALTGDASKPFVLLGKEKPQPFAKLAEAVAAAGDGDVIEIMGQGPFEMAGIHWADKSLTMRAGDGFDPVFAHKLELLQDAGRDPTLRSTIGIKGGGLSLEGVQIQIDPNQKSPSGWTAVSVDGGEFRAVNCSFTQSINAPVTGIELRGAAKANLLNCMFAGFTRALDVVSGGDQELNLENCLVYSRIGLQATSPDPKQAFGLSARFTSNTFHVGEVVNLSGLAGPADFVTEGNIFHASVFSNGMKPSASASAVRNWAGRRNVYDLTRWLSSAGQAVREVKDLETWRKYWKSKEEGSNTRSVPFAVNHQLGPFRHNTNPNDWRVSIDRLSPGLGSDVQIGCDSYLVGAGQAFAQFKESIAYDNWRSGPAATEGEPAKEGK